MSRTQKAVRPGTSKINRNQRTENAENLFGTYIPAYPETLAGVIKPLSPADSTLFRLIERIKNL